MGRVIRTQRRSHAIVRLLSIQPPIFLEFLIHLPTSSNRIPTTTKIPHACVISTSLSAMATFAESSRRSSTTLVAVHLLPVSSSVTPTATSSARKLSSPPKVCTLAPLSTAARRPLCPWVTSSPSLSALKERSSATSRRKLVTVVPLLAPQATTLPSLATRQMTTRRESGCLVVRRRRYPARHVRRLVSLLVVEGSISLC